jgi:hypothetical protein
MDKKLLNEIKRIKQLMNINENEVNEGMKDLMKAALLCAVLTTGEISCKRPEEILPSEKSSDLTRSVDGYFTTKPKNYIDIKDIENIKIPQDSIEEAKQYNPDRPWVGIWKMTFPWRVKNKEYLVWTSNGSDNIKDSRLYKCGYISDINKKIIEYVIKDINVTPIKSGFSITINYGIPSIDSNHNSVITFLLYDNNQKLKVVNWGDAGYAVRMNRIPYE